MYQDRINKLVAKMKPGLMILNSRPIQYYTKSENYPYRQNSYLYYFLPLHYPNLTLLIEKYDMIKIFLLIEPSSTMDDISNVTVNAELIRNTVDYKIDRYYTEPNQLDEIIKRNELIYCDEDYFHPKNKINKETISSTELIDDLRYIKSPEEINLIQKSIDTTSKGFWTLMQMIKPGMMEYQLEAILNFIYMFDGARFVSYNNIVASGLNANTLHYDANNNKIKNGELVLIDSGCQFEYTSDITRTIPVNGKFSTEQRTIYQMVLNIQMECIQMVKPGVTLKAIHHKYVELIINELIKLGVLDPKQKDDLKYVHQFYKHYIGHHLGLEVHDGGHYNYDKELKAGCVITIEPGVYIPHDLNSKYRGINIRIEDDVLVTEKGYKILSIKCPKTIDEIEKLMMTV